MITFITDRIDCPGRVERWRDKIYLLFPSSPPGEWHPAIPSREACRTMTRPVRMSPLSVVILVFLMAGP